MIECVIAAFLISDGVVTFITFQLKRKIGGNNLWDMILKRKKEKQLKPDAEP